MDHAPIAQTEQKDIDSTKRSKRGTSYQVFEDRLIKAVKEALSEVMSETGGARRRNDSGRSEHRGRAISSLNWHRIVLIKRVLKALARIVRDDAITGDRLHLWLKSHSDNILATIMAIASKISGGQKEVEAIIARADAGMNRHEAIELVALHQGVTYDTVLDAWKMRNRLKKKGHRKTW
jgi:hypothetical protein